MVILDTQVIAELMRRVPAPAVVRWVAACPPGEPAVTALTVGEILSAIAHVADDRRRRDLSTRFGAFLRVGFAARILPFDIVAASALADVIQARARIGRPIAARNATLAAVARANGASVATRFVRELSDCGLVVFDPWRRAASVSPPIPPLETGGEA